MPACLTSFASSILGLCIISLRRAYGQTGVMSRGDRRERILLDDEDRQDFLKTLV